VTENTDPTPENRGNSAVWRRAIEVHPYADKFPMLAGAELEGLVESVREHGVREPLERDPRRLNRKAGDSRRSNFLIQDAGWGWGPASDGKTLFTGPTGSGCRFGNSGAVVPGDGGAVWGKRGQRGEVVAALAADG